MIGGNNGRITHRADCSLINGAFGCDSRLAPVILVQGFATTVQVCLTLSTNGIGLLTLSTDGFGSFFLFHMKLVGFILVPRSANGFSLQSATDCRLVLHELQIKGKTSLAINNVR